MLDNRFFGFDECENNIGQAVSTFSNLRSVDQVIRTIKQIKNKMKMRFLIIGKTYQILYKNSVMVTKDYVCNRSSH